MDQRSKEVGLRGLIEELRGSDFLPESILGEKSEIIKTGFGYFTNKDGHVTAKAELPIGDHDLNISRMRVGQEEGGDKTMIFLRTDDVIPGDVMDKLRDLPLNITVTPFEL